MNCCYDLIVIGAGASGLMCCAEASSRGLSVLAVDPNRFPGRKLRITGKGRCNVTNNCSVRVIQNNIPHNPKFLYSALNSFPPEEVMNFFTSAGVPLKTERGSRVFPVSDNANDIADALIGICKRNRVTFERAVVTDVLIEDGKVCGIKIGDRSFYSPSVAVCTGGLSYPLTGSNGDGYRFAQKVGHTVVKTRPSLVPIESDDSYCSEMQGLSLRNVSLSLYENEKLIHNEFGEMLFTHFGVSGPLVLSASAHIRDLSANSYRFEIDLKPALDEKQLDTRILRDFSKYSNKDFKNSLVELVPNLMVGPVVHLSGIDENKKVNEITREERKNLLYILKHFPVSVASFRPIDEAIITSGGINTKEINPRTMESKLIHGLYFAGEVIDVDAYTGGFNLQIAWSTGYVAGKSVPNISENGENI